MNFEFLKVRYYMLAQGRKRAKKYKCMYCNE